MKLSSGIYSGQKLYTPKDSGMRPTLTKIRQAIFNMIRDRIQDSVIIDFFAGTGAFGLEALSNGAKKVIFVENKYKDIIYKNLSKLKIEKDRAMVLGYDFERAIKFLKKLNLKADIIFSDPPYNKGYIKKILKLFTLSDILIKNGLFILEIHRKEYDNSKDCFASFEIIKEKKYGDIFVLIIDKKEK